MLVFAIIMTVAVILLCGIIYLLLHQQPGGSKEPVKRSVVRQAIKDSPVQGDDIGGGNNASVPTHGKPGEGFQTLQACLTKGMAMIFSAENMPAENKAPLLTLDDDGDEVSQKVLSHIETMKSFDTLHKLLRTIGDPQTAMAELFRIITGDPMLTAKILRVANSPYYGMPQKLNSINHAIMIIGLANLKGIIYSEGILNVLNEKSFHHDPTMQALWQHANYTAICASCMGYLFRGLNQGTLFTLGILHDIGKFIMMKLPPLPGSDSTSTGAYSPYWTMEEEEKIYGINHTLVGRLAMQQWGLSELMVKTVSLHHTPGYLNLSEHGLDHEVLQYLLVLFLSDQAAKMIAAENAGTDINAAPINRLHPSYHGLIDQKRLHQLLLDQSFLGQLREAEAIGKAHV
jgi:HD-like signal output (HDOD) protein